MRFMELKEKVQTEPLVCEHCGDSCTASPVIRSGKAFCCTGCAGVYQLLHESDLGLYYELDKRPGRKIKEMSAAYSALDRWELSKPYIEFRREGIEIIRLKLPAIHCSSCIWLLENLGRLHSGVRTSRVNFSRREAVISYDPDRIKTSELAALLDQIGYPPDLSLDAASKNKKLHDRSLVYKIGLAGFAFGNTMLVALPEYFGLQTTEGLAVFFRWVALILSLPTAAYAGSDYFIASFKSLKKKEISIDLPIALGILVLALRSAYEVISGTGPGYFDSLTGLIFFLLLGKLAQRRTYDALAWDRDYTSFFPMNATRMAEDGREESLSLRELSVGDVLVVRNGELIPADGVLLEGSASIDYSFATGESEPVPHQPGDTVFAGGRQRGGSLKITVEKVLERSRLIQLWNDRAFEKESKDGFKNLTDRFSKSFTIRLLIVALLGGIYWWAVDPVKAIPVITAVLIVACPCALALSAPFALGNALRVFGRNGLYLKGTDAVESMARCSLAVFDKTGTLSVHGASKPVLEHDLDRLQLAGFRALSNQSGHPMSRAVASALGEGSTVELLDFEEVSGSGTQARIGSSIYRIGKPGFACDTPVADSGLILGIDGRVVGNLKTDIRYRPGLRSMAERLRELELEVELLSGDRDSERSKLLDILGTETMMLFDRSPTDKLEHVRSKELQGKRVLMVGDGLNDAGALKASSVGLGVVEEANTFTPACDGIIQGEKLDRLGDFLAFSKDAVRVVWWSFGLSIAYNLVGLGFALSGHLSPVVSAILMPLSSISVVLFVTLATEWKARKRGL